MFFDRFYRGLLLLSLLILSFPLFADTSVFVREYTYSASDNDSRVSARQAALQQLQALVIEEVGVQISSSFSQQTSQEKDEFNFQVQANIQSFAQALTRTRILEEQWNGETFYIKAEIEVDPSDIQQQINKIVAGNSGPVTCDSHKEEVMKVVRSTDSADRSKALVDFSLAASIDSDCYDWQYTILETLYHSTFSVAVAEYQTFLFEQLEELPPQELQYFIQPMLYWSLSKSSLSEQQWSRVMAAIERSHSDRLWALLQGLMAQTHFAEAKTDANAKRLAYERLWSQLNQLKKLALDKKLGVPLISNQEYSRLVYDHLEQAENKLRHRWLAQEYQSFKTVNDLFRPLIYQVKKDPETGLDQPDGKNLLLLIKHVESYSDEELESAKIFSEFIFLFRDWEKLGEVGQAAIIRLRDTAGKNLARILNSRTELHEDRDLFFVRYKLPNSKVCQPAECAKKLFSESKSEARYASEILLAYGVQASEQETTIARKLERLLVTSRGGDEGDTKRALIPLLGSFQTKNPKVISLLIRSLDSHDYKVPEKASVALVNLYPASVVVIESVWPEMTPLVQRRLVAALGKMPKDKDIQNFLLGITPKPSDDHLRFALEDALMAQQDN